MKDEKSADEPHGQESIDDKKNIDDKGSKLKGDIFVNSGERNDNFYEN